MKERPVKRWRLETDVSTYFVYGRSLIEAMDRVDPAVWRCDVCQPLIEAPALHDDESMGINGAGY